MNLSSFTVIKKLLMVAVAGIILSACANTMEGVGKDMQTMGNAMGGSNTSQTNNQSIPNKRERCCGDAC